MNCDHCKKVLKNFNQPFDFSFETIQGKLNILLCEDCVKWALKWLLLQNFVNFGLLYDKLNKQ